MQIWETLGNNLDPPTRTPVTSKFYVFTIDLPHQNILYILVL